VTLSGRAIQMLTAYDWPGNVRQLRNEITSAALRRSGGVIEPTDLSREIIESSMIDQQSVPGSGLDSRLDTYERAEICGALRLAGSNCSRAAEILGLKRTTLLYRMRRHGIVLKERRDE
jgi:transcriptional regulator of acetoin/glycerol metabolism